MGPHQILMQSRCSVFYLQWVKHEICHFIFYSSLDDFIEQFRIFSDQSLPAQIMYLWSLLKVQLLLNFISHFEAFSPNIEIQANLIGVSIWNGPSFLGLMGIEVQQLMKHHAELS